MPSKFEKNVKAMYEQETGEPCPWYVVEHEVEGMCAAFWAKWEGVGAEYAVHASPDVAEYLMYRQPGGELRTQIGRLLGAMKDGSRIEAERPTLLDQMPEPPKPVERAKPPIEKAQKLIDEVMAHGQDELAEWDADVLDVLERTPI